MRRFKLLAATVIAVSLLGAACSSSGTDVTTTIVGDDGSGVVFGRGSVPATVPESFPIPDQAVIGATLIDTNRGITEMVMNLPASLPAAAKYYEENLPLAGYEITANGGSEAEWEIVFIGGDTDGTIGIKAAGSGLSSVSVQLSTP
jgi:hypothetical protein